MLNFGRVNNAIYQTINPPCQVRRNTFRTPNSPICDLWCEDTSTGCYPSPCLVFCYRNSLRNLGESQCFLSNLKGFVLIRGPSPWWFPSGAAVHGKRGVHERRFERDADDSNQGTWDRHEVPLSGGDEGWDFLQDSEIKYTTPWKLNSKRHWK